MCKKHWWCGILPADLCRGRMCRSFTSAWASNMSLLPRNTVVCFGSSSIMITWLGMPCLCHWDCVMSGQSVGSLGLAWLVERSREESLSLWSAIKNEEEEKDAAQWGLNHLILKSNQFSEHNERRGGGVNEKNTNEETIAEKKMRSDRKRELQRSGEVEESQSEHLRKKEGLKDNM